MVLFFRTLCPPRGSHSLSPGDLPFWAELGLSKAATLFGTNPKSAQPEELESLKSAVFGCCEDTHD